MIPVVFQACPCYPLSYGGWEPSCKQVSEASPDMSEDCSEYRKEIDRIDDEILRLLNERSKSVVEIGKLKKEKDADANLHTAGREATIVERLTNRNSGPFPGEAIRSVYREIMSASFSLEVPQKVAYLGPRATFTHMACMQKFGSSVQYIPVTVSRRCSAKLSEVEPILGWCRSKTRRKAWSITRSTCSSIPIY